MIKNRLHGNCRLKMTSKLYISHRYLKDCKTTKIFLRLRQFKQGLFGKQEWISDGPKYYLHLREMIELLSAISMEKTVSTKLLYK